MSGITWSSRRRYAFDQTLLKQLAGVLIECVDGEVSVSFMHRSRSRVP